MRRFLASLRRDVLLQVRYKLVAVSLFMVAFWSGLLALVPEAFRPEPTLFVPAFVVINLLTTTFYFICGLVLFEKGEAVLSALVTTPLRDREYLLSKVVSLTLLACFETLGIVVLFFGVDVNWGLLLTGHSSAPTSPELMVELFVQNLRAFQAKEGLRGEVDFERGY